MWARSGVATCVAVIAALIGAVAFGVHARLELDSTRHALQRSQQSIVRLDAEIRAAGTRHVDAETALTNARDALERDTTTRDRLRTTDRVEYSRLTAALADLASHQREVTTNTARALRLDACLLAASQVLNEAAVGDTVHLAATLPDAQRQCEAAAA
jgi:hypothetical protein